MIKIDVVDYAEGNYFPLGDWQMFPGFGELYSPYPGPLLLSPKVALSSSFELERGNFKQGDIPFGLLREREVSHYNVAGHLLTSTTVPSCQLPFRGIVAWGQEMKDSLSLSYRGTYWDGRAASREAILQTSFKPLANDFLLVVYEYTILSQFLGGSVYQPERIGDIWVQWSLFDLSQDHEYVRWYEPEFRYYTKLPSSAAEETAYVSRSQSGGTPRMGVPYAPVTFTPLHSIDEIVTTISSQLDEFQVANPLVGSSEPVDFGELALECADQLDYVDSSKLSLVFDINDWRNIHTLWKNVSNLPGWKRALRVLQALVRRGTVPTPKQFAEMLRPSAALYLFKKYALDTMISDLRALAEGWVSLWTQIQKPKRLHSRRIVSLDPGDATYRLFTAVLTVEVDEVPGNVAEKIRNGIMRLKRLGVYPEMSNLYDILPYSFVVDWFVDYGGFVKECDAFLDARNYFPVHHCVMSVKWQAGYSSTSIFRDIPVSGEVEFIYYHRWITREVPLPPVDLSVGSGPISHGVESAALILQRVR